MEELWVRNPKVHFVKSKTCNDAPDLLSGEIDVAVHAGQTDPETYYFKYMAGSG